MRRLLLVWLAVVGCGSSGGAAADSSAGDVTSDVAQGGLGWETVEPISNDGEVIVEKVSYRVGALRIYGQVCRPVAAGSYPLIMYNHGGFFGLALDPELARCTDVAKLGYVWMSSSYRGEDGSEGAIEVCLGEVDDVLQMLAIARVQKYVDPTRAMMWGASHGGCITLRAVERGAAVRAAIDVFGPGDLAEVYSSWRDQIAAGSPASGTLMQLKQILDSAIGGPPETFAAAYAARSPIHFISDLPAGVPLLITHGAADQIVPVSQSCKLAAALAATDYHLDVQQHETAAAPPGCTGLTWTTTARPSSWPGSRYLVVYDGLDHGVPNDAPGMALIQDAATFTMAKL
jgi:dipeptidyl aminopeptidase/acylaminoacyl peptidase